MRRVSQVNAVTVRVPAKVNLQLGVGPIRDDGYHDLVNVFHAVSLCDEVTAEPAERLEVRVQAAPHSRVAIDGVPTGTDNLAARAARLVAARLGVEPAVRLRIRKAIPVAGGMAGGSADAAAALVACARLWDDREQPVLARDDLMDLGADLGSDVPFAVLGGTAVGVGRGERLTPALTRGTFHWVFATADGGLSTPAVYGECDRLRLDAGEEAAWPAVSEGLMTALATGDAKGLGAALSNDLQPAALSLRPALRRTIDAGRDLGAIGAVVSGSGPTCAFLAETAEDAAGLADALHGAGVAEQIVRAQGPVSGATVL
ncbi:4-(cytidine 5'-diphospho)-2-C-methyl-D-erythritol kinase [Actinomadura darangshiensis]|uniref:4-diphosphocytidyl-2-C-methyl-D-erythritol kinase n=1 Tax=Actinomadura darangshiensis TaxID=705336 RepID=A0A4R5BSX7_9ACTN|nr:4-(cytidine 5'-diphospho)-2-C-methyl-D-erythritol kinase [Actinomadura darangshiensis]TDD90161.1 4-(cytidine 5'-diphospho)-2-C-methyl-D-erythritol kinase [Actinomadura darangshiensis]